MSGVGSRNSQSAVDWARRKREQIERAAALRDERRAENEQGSYGYTDSKPATRAPPRETYADDPDYGRPLNTQASRSTMEKENRATSNPSVARQSSYGAQDFGSTLYQPKQAPEPVRSQPVESQRQVAVPKSASKPRYDAAEASRSSWAEETLEAVMRMDDRAVRHVLVDLIKGDSCCGRFCDHFSNIIGDHDVKNRNEYDNDRRSTKPNSANGQRSEPLPSISRGASADRRNVRENERGERTSERTNDRSASKRPEWNNDFADGYEEYAAPTSSRGSKPDPYATRSEPVQRAPSSTDVRGGARGGGGGGGGGGSNKDEAERMARASAQAQAALERQEADRKRQLLESQRTQQARAAPAQQQQQPSRAPPPQQQAASQARTQAPASRAPARQPYPEENEDEEAEEPAEDDEEYDDDGQGEYAGPGPNDPPEYDEAGTRLRACGSCGRKFAEDRLAKHQKICQKSASKKRRTFDVAKQRMDGEAAKLMKQNEGKPQAKPKKTAKWRQQHEEFIKSIRAAREYSEAVKTGADPPPPAAPSAPNPDYVRCPSCGRSFNEQAAERHIPKCGKSVPVAKPPPRRR